MANEKQRFKVELPEGLPDDIAEKIANAVREQYYHAIGTAIAQDVKEKLEEDGFVQRVAEAVVSRMRLDEDEYVNGIAGALKEQLLGTITVIAEEVLTKIQEKVKEYGFIEIGRRL